MKWSKASWKFFSSSWVLEYFFNFFNFFFFFWENDRFIFCLLRYLLKRLISISQMLFKTCVLKHFTILTGKHLYWSLFLIKLQDWRLVFSLKKRLQHRCFPINIPRFLKAAFLCCSLYFSKILYNDEY